MGSCPTRRRSRPPAPLQTPSLSWTGGTNSDAPLAETELAGVLVKHTGEYKTLIDTIRIACANAESELACILAPELRRPAEAKQVLLNLMKAPGDVEVGRRSITLRLAPAGTTNELHALALLLQECNTWDLVLPGDDRPLRFELQT